MMPCSSGCSSLALCLLVMLQQSCALKGVTQSADLTTSVMLADLLTFGCRWHNHMSC